MSLLISILFLLNMDLRSQTQVLAQVGDEKITLKEITSKLLVSNYSQTLEELIEEKILLQEAKKRGITISENELNNFLGLIKKRFNSESEFIKELRKINLTEKEYIQIIKNKLIADKTILSLLNVNITDQDALDYYETNKEQFKIPMALKLRQIFVLTEKEANDIIIALDAGADFIKLASIKNADEELRKRNGDLGYITKGMLIPEIEKEVFSTSKNKYTKPLKTGNGYSIIMVEDIRNEETIPFENIKENIKNSIILSILNTNKRKIIDELKKTYKIEIKN